MTQPRRALIVIDVQNEYFSGPLEIQYPPREQSLARILQVMEAATEQGLPLAVLQHRMAEGSPVFVPGTPGWELHPEVTARAAGAKRLEKEYASVFAETDLADWLREQAVDTVTLVGYMTNNCVLGSAVDAEARSLTVEVLSDATGAIHIANAVGRSDAQTTHEVIMALLNSNFAAVATTDEWLACLGSGEPLPRSNLGESAITGRQAYAG